jgi:hypothetical protein
VTARSANYNTRRCDNPTHSSRYIQLKLKPKVNIMKNHFQFNNDSTTRTKAWHTALLVSAVSLSAATTSQADVIFEENFTNGIGQFTAQGNTYVGDGEVRLRGDSNNDPGDGSITSSAISTLGFSNITLSFDRTTSGLDSGESGQALIAINGGAFTAVESMQDASGRTTVNLAASAENASVQLAFRIDASSFFEVYTIDNVVLEGDVENGGGGDNAAATGFYLEGGASATEPDQFSFTNSGDASITSLTIDLSSGVGNPVFDPADVPFAVTSTDAVGFNGNFSLTGNNLLQLNFDGFDPGETFSFNTDLDDEPGTFTTGAEVAGSTLSVAAVNPDGVSGTFSADGGNANRATVNTNGGGGGDTVPFDTLYDRAAGDGNCSVTIDSTFGSTLYIPSDPGNPNAQFNVLVWGNGTGGSSSTYSTLLNSVASHCIAVAAANTASAGSGTAMASALSSMRSQHADILLPDHIVCTAGHSQGGGGAFNAANLTDADCTIPVQPDTIFTTQIDDPLASDVEAIVLTSSADTLAGPGTNRPNVEANSTILTQITSQGESHFAPTTGRGGIIGTLFRMANIAQLSPDPVLRCENRRAFWGPNGESTVPESDSRINDVRRNSAAVANPPC